MESPNHFTLLETNRARDGEIKRREGVFIEDTAGFLEVIQSYSYYQSHIFCAIIWPYKWLLVNESLGMKHSLNHLLPYSRFISSFYIKKSRKKGGILLKMTNLPTSPVTQCWWCQDHLWNWQKPGSGTPLCPTTTSSLISSVTSAWSSSHLHAALGFHGWGWKPHLWTGKGFFVFDKACKWHRGSSGNKRGSNERAD